MLRRKKTGQSTAEYAIVIGLVIAAAVGMQVYVKRGIQAKIKGAVDYVPPDSGFTGKQYEPYYASSELDTERKSEVNINTKAGGEVTRTISAEGEITKRSGTQTTTALAE